MLLTPEINNMSLTCCWFLIGPITFLSRLKTDTEWNQIISRYILVLQSIGKEGQKDWSPFFSYIFGQLTQKLIFCIVTDAELVMHIQRAYGSTCIWLGECRLLLPVFLEHQRLITGLGINEAMLKVSLKVKFLSQAESGKTHIIGERLGLNLPSQKDIVRMQGSLQ